jgi:hypothetical protein
MPKVARKLTEADLAAAKILFAECVMLAIILAFASPETSRGPNGIFRGGTENRAGGVRLSRSISTIDF